MEKGEPRNNLGGQRKEATPGPPEDRMEDWYGATGITEFEEGEGVRGRVVHVGTSEVLIDVGYKSEGAIPIEEFHRSGTLPKVGDELDVYLEAKEDAEGLIVLSEEKKKHTLEVLHEGMVLTGTVKNITDYGAFIDLGGIDGLLHVTDMSWGRVGHPSEIFQVGDQVEVVVLHFDRETGRVSLGYKQKSSDPWERVEKTYAAGTKTRGKVVSLTNYGAFIELEPGVEGLVHVSEMSWTRRVRHPSKLVNVGDEVEVIVLDVNRAAKRISLGMKQVEPDPWATIEERYRPGARAIGRVRNLTDFGAFVELEPGVDGLLHISDMSWTRNVGHPSEILKKGQELETQILNLDRENKRISLGLKQIQPDPWTTVAQRYPMGSRVTGKIVRLTDFGAFVELEPGVDGLLHISQMSSRPIGRPDELVSVGDELTLLVIRVDANERRIGLSLKELAHAIEPPKETEERGGGRRGRRGKHRDDYEDDDEE